MPTISVRFNDDGYAAICEYASANGTTMSELIREAVLEKIEADLELDEERILRALERAKRERSHDHSEVWRMLGI